MVEPDVAPHLTLDDLLAAKRATDEKELARLTFFARCGATEGEVAACERHVRRCLACASGNSTITAPAATAAAAAVAEPCPRTELARLKATKRLRRPACMQARDDPARNFSQDGAKPFWCESSRT